MFCRFLVFLFMPDNKVKKNVLINIIILEEPQTDLKFQVFELLIV